MDAKNTKTISVTMWVGQAELIANAAKKQDVSVSEIIRAATIPAAAKILGMATPNFEPFEPPHFRRGAISLAAESMGLTPEQFKQRMAERAAEEVLKEIQNKRPVRRRRRVVG